MQNQMELFGYRALWARTWVAWAGLFRTNRPNADRFMTCTHIAPGKGRCNAPNAEQRSIMASARERMVFALALARAVRLHGVSTVTALSIITALAMGCTSLAVAGELPDLDVRDAAAHETASPDDPGRRNTLIIGAGAGLVGLYGAKAWWNEGFSGTFRTVDEGWLGEGTPHGGADKLGHAWFTYAASRTMARVFEAAGNQPGTALRLGVLSSLGVMMGVEILDGLSRQYRFSYQDAVMNMAGAGLAYALETHPDLNQLLAYRFLYWPSPGHGFDPGADYGGQIYLLAIKGSGISATQASPWTRYLELDFGYGARGYETPRSADPHRNLYVGVSVNLCEWLCSKFDQAQDRNLAARRAAETFFDLVQVPGTALLHRRRL